MQFKKCTINGVVYGNGVHPEVLFKQRNSALLSIKRPTLAGIARRKYSEKLSSQAQTPNETSLKESETKFYDPLLLNELRDSNCKQYSAIRDFFTSLAICHSVLVTKDVNNPNSFKYMAQSPDESALVNAAKDVGFIFTDRINSCVVVVSNRSLNIIFFVKYSL